MIDISKTPTANPDQQKTLPKPTLTLLLALALAWVVYDTSYWKKFIPDTVIPSQDAAQVLFVTSSDMTNGQGQVAISQRIEKFCDDKGIEKRRLEAGQDVSGAESWLQDMAELGYGQAPCVVFRSRTGQVDIIPIPNSLDSMLAEIQKRIP